MLHEILSVIANKLNHTIIYQLDDDFKTRINNTLKKHFLEKLNRTNIRDLDLIITEIINECVIGLPLVHSIKNVRFAIDTKAYDLFNKVLNSAKYINNNKDYNIIEQLFYKKQTLYSYIEIVCTDSVEDMVNEYELRNIDNVILINGMKQLTNTLAIGCGEELTPREVALYKLYLIEYTFIPATKQAILAAFNIKNNSQAINQDILNNSYQTIITKLQSHINHKNDLQQVIELIRLEQNNNTDLFTNNKRFTKLQQNQHYMSFLYKCNTVVALGDDLLVFKEFTEALIFGYVQYIEVKNITNTKITELKKELIILKKYNLSEENENNIKNLEHRIKLLPIAKPLQRLIPYKILADKLEINKTQISNYVLAMHSISKNTTTNSFNKLPNIGLTFTIG